MAPPLPLVQHRLASPRGWIVSTLIARAGVVAAAVAFVLLYLTLALIRLRYPFELEWMEGAMVDQVQRVVEGRPMYVAPTLDFVPFLYPPVYFWASAAVAMVTGVGFVALRLVSLVASLTVLVLIYGY